MLKRSRIRAGSGVEAIELRPDPIPTRASHRAPLTDLETLQLETETLATVAIAKAENRIAGIDGILERAAASYMRARQLERDARIVAGRARSQREAIATLIWGVS